MWVEIEYGNSAMGDAKYGMALKKFLATKKHFQVWCGVVYRC